MYPIDLLACPECGHEDLVPADDLTALPPPYDVTTGLRCAGCSRDFPIVDGIYVLWSDGLKAIQLAAPPEDASLADRVMRANIEIYDEVADVHGEHSDHLFSYQDTLLFLKAFAGQHQTPAEPGRRRVTVDVGCASGIGLDAGSNFYDVCIGVDIALNNLRRLVAKGHIAILGDSSRLPLRGGVADLVTCFAALHHFPSATDFAASSHRILREGGVLLTGCDPSDRLLSFGPVAQLVWDLRLPVYRTLAKVSPRFYLHRDHGQQTRNDLAEHKRTEGGFAPDGLRGALQAGGFDEVRVFHGLDPEGRTKVAVPDWKLFLLKALSLQNPVRPENWMTLSSMSRKGASGA